MTTRLRTIIAVGAFMLAGVVGLALWFGVSVADRSPNAQAAVKAGCDKVELAGSFDAQSVVTTRKDGEIEGKTRLLALRYSGNDYHGIETVVGEEGIRTEFIRLDGVSYWKSKGEGWIIFPEGAFGDFFPACDKLQSISALGEDSLDDGTKANRFSAKDEPLTSHLTTDSTQVHSNRFEYWVGDDGGFVRHKREIILEATQNGVTERWVTEMLYTFSGFGDPNVITPPENAVPYE